MKRVSAILLVIGSALLVWCGIVWTGTALFDWYEGREVLRPLHSHAARIPFAPHPHEILGRLMIPRLGLTTVVLEGADEMSLRFGAGHVTGTALPDHAGNVGIAAHRETVFRSLRNIAARDDIEFSTPRGAFHYQVTSTEIVPPQDTAVLDTSSGDELTLVTCYPFSYIGPAPLRFIVHARRT